MHDHEGDSTKHSVGIVKSTVKFVMYRLQYDFHRVPLENFSLMWRRHHYIAGEVLQSLTYAQRS